MILRRMSWAQAALPVCIPDTEDPRPGLVYAALPL